MSDFLEVLENNIDSNKLIDIAKTLNKIHSPYLLDSQIWEALSYALGNEYKFIKSYKNRISAHKLLNDIIIKYYPNERIIKYFLVKKYLNREKEVTLFEMNVDNSRVDLCRINGTSIAYEIKTEFDSTTRLIKQVDDYLKVFEKVYLVVHLAHFEKVKKISPECCGIITYRYKEGECIFATRRKAQKNKNVSLTSQIKNLNSDDLRIILQHLNVKGIPSTREARVNLILESCDERKINNLFKYAIKYRYKKQWKLLCDNFKEILPIDIQSFFHSPIDPNLLYLGRLNDSKTKIYP